MGTNEKGCFLAQFEGCGKPEPSGSVWQNLDVAAEPMDEVEKLLRRLKPLTLYAELGKLGVYLRLEFGTTRQFGYQVQGSRLTGLHFAQPAKWVSGIADLDGSVSILLDEVDHLLVANTSWKGVRKAGTCC